MPTDAVDVIADLKPNGSPVTSRISDPDQARDIGNRFIQDDMIRAGRRAKVQALIDGNAPRSRSATDRQTDANLNWREAHGHILNAWTPYYDLTCEVPVCIDGDLDYAGSDLDGELMRGFAEAFHKLLFGWRGFDRVTQLRDWQMLVHGIGTLVWEDSFDWRPRAVLSGHVFVESESDSDLENCECVMIVNTVKARYLYRQIENEKWAVAMGWKPEAVRDCILNSSMAESIAYGLYWERVQQMYKNGDIWMSETQTKKIELRTLFVKEMDGKISQHIVSPAGTKPQFLFTHLRRFDDWNQCICSFPYDVGSDGTWHSVKGLGTEIFPFCELSNRIKNTVADLILTGTKPMFQPTTGTDAQKFQLLKLSGFNVLPPGLNMIEMNVHGNIMPALEVSRDMDNTLMRNTGTYQAGDLSRPTVEETAKAATIRAMDRSKLTKGAHNRQYRGMDREYQEVWRRATNPNLREYHPGAKEALEFQMECKRLCRKMGVSETALQHVRNIRATRSLGLGSAAMRIEIAEAIMRQYPLLDEVGRNNALRMYFAALTSYHSVDALVPSLTTGQVMTEDNSIAALENNALNTGGQVIITPRQNHVIHLEVHIGDMENDAEQVNQGADPREIYGRLEAKGLHANEHLKKLEENPTRKQEAKAFAERLNMLASFQDHLQQNIEEQDAAAPPPEGQSTPEMAKVQGDLQLKSQKQQATLALKAQNQSFSQQMKARQLAFDSATKDAIAAAEIQRKNALAVSSQSGV